MVSPTGAHTHEENQPAGGGQFIHSPHILLLLELNNCISNSIPCAKCDSNSMTLKRALWQEYNRTLLIVCSHCMQFPKANICNQEHKEWPNTVMLLFHFLMCSWKTWLFGTDIQFITTWRLYNMLSNHYSSCAIWIGRKARAIESSGDPLRQLSCSTLFYMLSPSHSQL